MTIPVRKINDIYVVQSLPVGDKPTGQELYEDVIKRHIDFLQPEKIKMTHFYLEPNNKNNFSESLRYIQSNIPYQQGGILIHFEIHGSNKQDGLILADNSFVSWKELVEFLRPINISTCNKLFITMATCYGRYLYIGVDPFEKSPYQAYVSASREVKTFEVLESFNTLFEILIASGDLIYAYLEHEKTNSPFYYKDSLATFEDTMKMYRNGLDTNPEYKQKILDHPVLQEQLSSRQINQAIIDHMIKAAFDEIVLRQVEAFNFTECD